MSKSFASGLLGLILFLAGIGMCVLGGMTLYRSAEERMYLAHIEESLEYNLRTHKITMRQSVPPSRSTCEAYIGRNLSLFTEAP